MTDCCGCTLTDEAEEITAIECESPGTLTSDKQASPGTAEKCGTITYTNTYTFADKDRI